MIKSIWLGMVWGGPMVMVDTDREVCFSRYV